MPDPRHHSLAQKFSALSDPTRLAIAERLMEQGEMTVGDLSKPFNISSPAISRHLAVLERSGLIERRVEKQWRICRVRPDAMRTLADWIAEHRMFWEGSLDRLAKLFAEGSNNGETKE